MVRAAHPDAVGAELVDALVVEDDEARAVDPYAHGATGFTRIRVELRDSCLRVDVHNPNQDRALWRGRGPVRLHAVDVEELRELSFRALAFEPVSLSPGLRFAVRDA